MSTKRLAVLVSLALALAGYVGCGKDYAIVGGECAPGYVECDGACVDISQDPGHCGACGRVCASGICTNGSCTGETAGDASTDGNGTVDATLLDAADADGSNGGDTSTGNDATSGDGSSDGSNDGSNDGSASNDGALDDGCVPPFNTPARCGSCSTTCAPADQCSQVDAGVFQCQPFCTGSQVNCQGVCVDVQTDPDNCGQCGKFCASNLCIAGVCSGSTPGNIVYIGHDYSNGPAGTSQARILTNAVFLPLANRVRVLSYERYAEPTTVTRIKQILTSHATNAGRQIVFTSTSSDTTIPATLTVANFEALLVYDQGAAPAGALATLGASWASSLFTYIGAGGNVIVLDGAAGTTQEMHLFASGAGLLNVASHTPIAAGSAVSVVTPGDALAIGVLSPYGVFNRTVRFNVTGPNQGVTVVQDVGPSPVVVHRVGL